MKPTDQAKRLLIANNVLETFAADTWMALLDGYVWVHWRRHNGVTDQRRWQTRGQDFYPVWSNRWGHGGTACTALSQLVRWIQGKPVLPLATWRMWTGERVALGRERGVHAVASLAAAGYPEIVKCVLCGGDLITSLDWWSLNKVSGPCCTSHNGCRQKRDIA